MEAKTKKKVILIVVSVALVVLVAVSAVLYLVLGNKKKKDEPNNATNVSNTISYTTGYEYTNCYNESIMKKVLATSNYNGEYKLSSVISVDFNEDLTNDNIKKIISDNGARDLNSFKSYLLSLRSKNLETFSIARYLSSSGNGDVVEYGTFTATSGNDSYYISSGSIYGDDNLAVIAFETLDPNFFISSTYKIIYISLNYNPVTGSENVSDTVGETTSDKLYVFENVYSSNNPSLRLFTVTYSYNLVINTTKIPDADLVFGK